MMLNRYSVGANLNKLQSKTALGELRFDPDDWAESEVLKGWSELLLKVQI